MPTNRVAGRLTDRGIDAEAVLESTMDAVVVLDRRGRFIYLDNHARELIGDSRRARGGNPRLGSGPRL